VIPVIATLRDRFGIDLQDISGAKLTGEIPFSDDVVNRVVAAQLANHAQIASVRVRAQEGDALTVVVTPRSRLLPSMQILARIEAQPEFPHRPTLVLRWTMPALGPLALLAAPALAFFKAMPPGISVDGNRAVVDLRELLETRGLGDLATLIRRAAIHTRAGGFFLGVEIGVGGL
jgi:hypothetical protein